MNWKTFSLIVTIFGAVYNLLIAIILRPQTGRAVALVTIPLVLIAVGLLFVVLWLMGALV